MITLWITRRIVPSWCFYYNLKESVFEMSISVQNKIINSSDNATVNSIFNLNNILKLCLKKNIVAV